MSRIYERPTIADLGTLADLTKGDHPLVSGGIAVSLEGADVYGPGGVEVHTGGISVNQGIEINQP